MENIKPCPFCGMDDTEVQRLHGYSNWGAMYCNYCGAIGPDIRILPREDEQQWHARVIEVWNDRANEQEAEQ